MFFVVRILLFSSSVLYFCWILIATIISKEKGLSGVHGRSATTLFLISLGFGMLFTEIYYSATLQIRVFLGLFKKLDISGNPFDKLSYKIVGDPEREVVLCEDVHSLAYTLCLKRCELIKKLGETYEDKAKVVHCMPDDAIKNEVFIACIFCTVVQLFLSFLLLSYSVQEMKNDDENYEFTYVSW